MAKEQRFTHEPAPQEKVACLGDPVSRRGAIPWGEDFLYGGKAG